MKDEGGHGSERYIEGNPVSVDMRKKFHREDFRGLVAHEKTGEHLGNLYHSHPNYQVWHVEYGRGKPLFGGRGIEGKHFKKAGSSALSTGRDVKNFTLDPETVKP